MAAHNRSLARKLSLILVATNKIKAFYVRDNNIKTALDSVSTEETITNSLNSLAEQNSSLSQPFRMPCVDFYEVEIPEKLNYNSTSDQKFPYQFIPLPQASFSGSLPADDSGSRKQRSTLPPSGEVVVQRFAKKNFGQMEDESSWCDVSEMSTTSAATAYASGDSARMNEVSERRSLLLDEMTVSRMVGLIKKLQKENQQIYRRVLQEGNDFYEKVMDQQEGEKGKASDSRANSLCGQVVCLKKRLEELQEIKRTLQIQGLHGHDTLEILELELKASQAKNAELQSTIVMLENKLRESELVKQKQDLSALKRKLTDTHGREIQMLKELHNQEMVQLKALQEQKYAEMQQLYNARVEEVKNSYENDIVHLKESYQNMLERKEQQIKLLEETVQKQCSRMEEEVKFIQEHLKNNTAAADNKCYAEKIQALETCVVKLDKLFKRSEKAYQKQICKLKKKIKLCNKANEMLMHSRKLNLLADSSDERQKNVEKLVNELENHYKNLLDLVLEQTLSSKMKDEAVITELRERMLKTQPET